MADAGESFQKYPEVGSVISNILSTDNNKYHFSGIYFIDVEQYLASSFYYQNTMRLYLIWIIPIVMLSAGPRATISRSPKIEMKQLRGQEVAIPDVDLDEYWPFSQTLSAIDPYLYELERQLVKADYGI